MSEFSVLFVDDEPLTRRVSMRLLGRHYQVLEADSGVTALACLAQNSADIGVIITDMKMDEMDGMSLIEKVFIDYPDIPVIASTGDLSNYDFPKLMDEGKIFSALEKPWDFHKALSTIDAAMQAFTERTG
jgi:CheY-like chemotaxis protein